ncbi:MAG TPA: glutathione S-transferase C-terminal domain-containing protein [Methylophilaceae bacterium]|nr:glutathione S-transferase C-terminal domain-containing protein [Methylophilaceae bacterium]
MKLLYSVTSPYARKVRIVAAEKRIELELEPVVLSSPDSPVPAYNPLGKVPVLVLDDDSSLFDSRVIAEFLDNRNPLAHLIPLDPAQKILVRRWEALADGATDAAVAALMESRRPKDLQDPAWITKQRGKVEHGLKALSDDLGKGKWCVNDTFSLADIALGCFLGYLEFRFEDINWKHQYPNLARHYDKLMKRDSFRDSIPISS